MVVAQSGGPSPVINNTLRGIVEAARDLDQIGTVYGARHGIEGVLKEELLDLSSQDPPKLHSCERLPALDRSARAVTNSKIISRRISIARLM